MDLENQEPSEIITDLRENPDQTNEVTQETQQSAEPSPQTAPAQTPAPDQRDEEIARLTRVIAADPNLANMYLAERYGQPASVQYQQQMPQFQSPMEPDFQMFQQKQEEVATPWSEDEPYDPFNVDHQNFLLQQQVSTLLRPFAAFIQQSAERDQQYFQAQQMQSFQQKEQSLHATLNQYIPGMQELFKVENPTDDQRAFWHYSRQVFLDALNQYPESFRMNDKVHQEIAAQIAPQLKTLAHKWQVLPTADPAKEQEAKLRRQETYVEGSNAVPSGGGYRNAFDDALKREDEVGMMRALRLGD